MLVKRFAKFLKLRFDAASPRAVRLAAVGQGRCSGVGHGLHTALFLSRRVIAPGGQHSPFISFLRLTDVSALNLKSPLGVAQRFLPIRASSNNFLRPS